MEEPQILKTSDQENSTALPVSGKDKLGKREIGLIIFVAVAIVGAGLFALMTGREKTRSINSFADCVAAGNPVMESYPEQCAANGQTWSNPDQTAPTLPEN